MDRLSSSYEYKQCELSFNKEQRGDVPFSGARRLLHIDLLQEQKQQVSLVHA